jgi:hypothetical protein
LADGSVRLIPETVDFRGNPPDWNDQLGVWMKLNTMGGGLPAELP